MKLRHDPFQIFRSSKTPAGLYARQKWLQEFDTPQWQSDFQENLDALWADQLPDGSWYRSALTTIVHRFCPASSAAKMIRRFWLYINGCARKG